MTGPSKTAQDRTRFLEASVSHAGRDRASFSDKVWYLLLSELKFDVLPRRVKVHHRDLSGGTLSKSQTFDER